MKGWKVFPIHRLPWVVCRSRENSSSMFGIDIFLRNRWVSLITIKISIGSYRRRRNCSVRIINRSIESISSRFCFIRIRGMRWEVLSIANRRKSSMNESENLFAEIKKDNCVKEEGTNLETIAEQLKGNLISVYSRIFSSTIIAVLFDL